jgi:putative membrane protein
MKILVHWLVATLAILVTAYVLPGVMVSGFVAAAVTAVILGVINAFIRPLVILLTLPVNILTLGLFTFVINALMIMLAAAVVPGFEVAGFLWALLFSLILSLVMALFSMME